MSNCNTGDCKCNEINSKMKMIIDWKNVYVDGLPEKRVASYREKEMYGDNIESLPVLFYTNGYIYTGAPFIKNLPCDDLSRVMWEAQCVDISFWNITYWAYLPKDLILELQKN